MAAISPAFRFKISGTFGASAATPVATKSTVSLISPIAMVKVAVYSFASVGAKVIVIVPSTSSAVKPSPSTVTFAVSSEFSTL